MYFTSQRLLVRLLTVCKKMVESVVHIYRYLLLAVHPLAGVPVQV